MQDKEAEALASLKSRYKARLMRGETEIKRGVVGSDQAKLVLYTNGRTGRHCHGTKAPSWRIGDGTNQISNLRLRFESVRLRA